MNCKCFYMPNSLKSVNTGLGKYTFALGFEESLGISLHMNAGSGHLLHGAHGGHFSLSSSKLSSIEGHSGHTGGTTCDFSIYKFSWPTGI